MNEIIQDLVNGLSEYKTERKTGSVLIKVNFYRGGIGNFNLIKEESKKLKMGTIKENT